MLNKELPERVNEFLDDLNILEKKSENTINAYANDLKYFFKFMKLHKKKGINITKDIHLNKVKINDISDFFIKKITLENVEEYQRYLSEIKEDKASSIIRKISTLKKFYKYLRQKKVVNENIIEYINNPKLPKRQPKFLNIEESKKLLDELANGHTINSKRDYCIMTLFLHCGLRISELINIKIQDIDTINNSLRVIGKGNKERLINLDKTCINVIQDYLLIRKNIENNIKSIDDKDYLFISNCHCQISTERIRDILENVLKRIGLEDKGITPHKLRHSFATLMYNSGVMDIVELQEVLGHENIETTKIYTHVGNNRMKDKMEKNPLNE